MTDLDVGLPSFVVEALPPLPDSPLTFAPALLGSWALSIPDSPGGKKRCPALFYAQFLRQQSFKEPIVLHLRTRDQDAASLVSAALKAYECGIRHLLVLSGDGDDAPAFDSVQGLQALNVLKDAGLRLGATYNPYARDLRLENERLHRKLAAGADFIFTQPVLSEERGLKTFEDLERAGVERAWLGLIESKTLLAKPRLAARIGFPDSEIERAADPARIVSRLKNLVSGFYWCAP